MWLTWVRAVAGLRKSSAPISALLSPRPTSASTSRSRAVSPASRSSPPPATRPWPGKRPMRPRAPRGPPGGGEVADEAPGDARREQGLARRDDPDRVDELGRPGVLEQEAARPGLERVEDVGVGLVGGEDEHPGALQPRGADDAPGGGDPVEVGH